MASKAYLDILNSIPKDIQNEVIGSLNIANEIHVALKMQGKSPADLARMLNKSESEISKWLTGLHNFTLKTVRKIEDVLEVKLLVTKSSKMEEYEDELKICKSEIERLSCKIEDLECEREGFMAYNEIDTIIFSSNISSDVESYGRIVGENQFFENFIVKGNLSDKVKISPETASLITFSGLE